MVLFKNLGNYTLRRSAPPPLLPPSLPCFLILFSLSYTASFCLFSCCSSSPASSLASLLPHLLEAKYTNYENDKLSVGGNGLLILLSKQHNGYASYHCKPRVQIGLMAHQGCILWSV